MIEFLCAIDINGERQADNNIKVRPSNLNELGGKSFW